MIPDVLTLAAAWTPTGAHPGRVSVALALQLLLTWRLAPIVGEGLVERIRRRRQPHPPGWSPSRGRRHGAGPTPPGPAPHKEKPMSDLRRRIAGLFRYVPVSDLEAQRNAFAAKVEYWCDTPGIDLDAIQARAERATPGPWWNESGVIHAPAWWADAVPGAACHPAATFGRNGRDYETDAEFIAHARTDVPALVAEVRRLREHTEWLRTRYLATDKEATGWVSQLADAETEIRRLRTEVSALLDKCDRAEAAGRKLAAIRELVPASPGGPGYRTCYDLAADIRRILDNHGGTS